MKYEINRLCILNQETPTPCKQYMDIAINVVPVKENDKFENFVLGIDPTQQCYEEYGYGCTLGYGFNEKKFVESIEVGIDIPDRLLQVESIDYYDAFGVKINIRNEQPVYAWVYNAHNGYYYHTIYYTNSSLKVDCLEEDYL